MYRGKRLLDLSVATVAVGVLSPLMAGAYLLVRLTSRGPGLFRQERMGLGGRTFQLYKFRTMTDRPRVSAGEIFAGDPEVTAAGRWLRRFKVDELPQLLNVIRGDMSLVGPRPDLPAHLATYDERGRRRLLARPGLTGLAQVNGNIHLSWPERWQYDARYVSECSLWLDLWIIVRTLAVVARGEERFVVRPPGSARPLAGGADARPEAAGRGAD